MANESRFDFYLNNVVTLLILGNTVTLAMDRSPISQEEADALEVCNFAFTVAFTLEMLFKLRKR